MGQRFVVRAMKGVGGARAVVLMLAAGTALGWAGVSPARAQERRVRPAEVTCDSCEAVERAALSRRLEEAQRTLEEARARVEAQRAALREVDTSGELLEAFARAQGELRRATERYNAVMAELMRRDLARARRDAFRAMQRSAEVVPGRPAGWIGVTFSGSFSIRREDGKDVMVFNDYPTIETVEPGSPAERAGIEARDRLLALNGHDVTEGAEPFARLLKPGTRLPIRIRRNGTTKDLTVVVERRPESDWPDWSFHVGPDHFRPVPVIPPTPPLPPFPRLELELDSASTMLILRGPELATIAGAQIQRVDELKDYFGVSDGLVVLHVVPNTPADRAGLRGGDVIVRAAGRTVTSPLQLSRVLSRASDQQVRLEIVRKKQRRVVLLKWEGRD